MRKCPIYADVTAVTGFTRDRLDIACISVHQPIGCASPFSTIARARSRPLFRPRPERMRILPEGRDNDSRRIPCCSSFLTRPDFRVGFSLTGVSWSSASASCPRCSTVQGLATRRVSSYETYTLASLAFPEKGRVLRAVAMQKERFAANPSRSQVFRNTEAMFSHEIAGLRGKGWQGHKTRAGKFLGWRSPITFIL